jgi:precorrin-6B methylase 2
VRSEEAVSLDAGRRGSTLSLKLQDAYSMKIMGVELNASDLCYVLLNVTSDAHEVLAANRLRLADTRSRSALSAFQSALLTTMNDGAPDLIAVKTKPESGRLRAGSAALKMEALLLARHAELGGDLTRLSVSRVAPVGSMSGWRPAMPVTQWSWVKP